MDGDRGRNGRNNAPLFILALILSLAVLAVGVHFGLRLLRSTRDQEISRQETSIETGNAAAGLDGTAGSLSQNAELQEESADSGSGDGGTAGSANGSKKAMVLDVSDVVAQVMPSVVAITNKSVQEVQYMFRGTMEVESESSGSGIIVGKTDTELLIATNYHVIADAASLTVCFTVDMENEEDAIVEAVVKGSDEQYDLAVVSVSMEDIHEDVLAQMAVATLGSSADLNVGEPAIAIGNALGYGQSVTLGIISALNRTVTIDGIPNNYIQTDAAINFGNSGGALLNVDGEVIGINSAKAAASGVEGMGYAIPIDEAQPILAELMERETRTKAEESERGYLGVYTQDISSEAQKLYNIPNGVYVSYVVSGSPAEAAGLKRGDIISSVDGITVTSTSGLEELLEYYRVGETVSVGILRAELGSYVSQDVAVTFIGRPEEERRKSYE